MTKRAPSGGNSTTGSGRRLSPKQIAELMRSVGFVQPQAPHGTTPGWDPNAFLGDAVVSVGVAIALAESGGDPLEIHHNSNGSTDYGLWQINSVHSDLLAKYDWRNPRDNTIMAREIWKAHGFGAWSTYNNGAWEKHASQGDAGLKGAVGDYLHAQSPQVQLPALGRHIGDAAAAVAAPFKSIGDFLGWISDPHNMLRVVEVVGGGAALLIGLGMLAKSGAAGSTVSNAANKVTSTAKHAAELAAL